MAFLRHGQRIMQGRTPTQGNQQWIVPKRGAGGEFPTDRWVFEFDGAASFINTGITDPAAFGTYWEATFIYQGPGNTTTPYLLSSQNNQNAIYLTSTRALVTYQRGGEAAGGAFDVRNGAHTVSLAVDDANANAPVCIGEVNGGDTVTFTGGTSNTQNTYKVGVRGSGTNNFFEGVIAEVKIWQFTDDPTSGPPQIYLKIDEGSGTDIVNYGTIGGTVPLTPGAGQWVYYE